MTGEISDQYAHHFHEQTAGLAAGPAHLLIVDGHTLHYSRGFLEAMREHNIHVICYPSHTTHIYQALDVALFSPLKVAFVEERDHFERENHEPASYTNFLRIYGAAHVRALTVEKVVHAMEWAGTWPISKFIVTARVLATSRDSSWTAHLPLIVPTPVCKMMQSLQLSNPDQYDPPDSPTPAVA